MAIGTTAAEQIFENIIKDLILAGKNPLLTDVIKEFLAKTNGKDLNKPFTTVSNFKIALNEESSASKFNKMQDSIFSDLQVLYTELFNITDTSMKYFDRWKAESIAIEKRISDLNARIDSLLLLSKDADNYTSYIEDNFSDANNIDNINSNIVLDPIKQRVFIPITGESPSRISLNTIAPTDVTFNILSTRHLVSRAEAPNSALQYALTDDSRFWQTRVFTNNTTQPVTAELNIKLPSLQKISRISIDLHTGSATSPTQITPLLSSDGSNFLQLKTTEFIKSGLRNIVFTFPATEAQYIKFIMIKDSPDHSDDRFYVYEFGASDIAFFNEGYTKSKSFSFISKDWSLTEDTTGIKSSAKKGSSDKAKTKVSLETCEEVPDKTRIDYYLAVDRTNTTIDVTASGLDWIALDPFNRDKRTKPTVVDLAKLTELSYSDVSLSYDVSGSTGFINPGTSFKVIYAKDLTGTLQSASGHDPRYNFINPEDRILNYQFDTSASTGVSIRDLRIWRNIGEVGSTTLVREQPIGWGFSDPYYTSTIKIKNIDGKEIDFGDKPIVLDGSFVSGKQTITFGAHTIKVHKDNFLSVTASYNSESTLRDNDRLYPFNHRLLIEGYKYGSSYPSSDPKIYTGVDIFAEYLMSSTKVFDFLNSLPSTNYSKYTLDDDMGNIFIPSGATSSISTKVILLKVNTSLADFINEKFIVELDVTELPFTNLRLRADLSTEDEKISPVLTHYRLKLL